MYNITIKNVPIPIQEYRIYYILIIYVQIGRVQWALARPKVY